MTVIYLDAIQIYAGDTATISVKINGIEYSDYDNWKAQWRVNENSVKLIESTIVVGAEYIDIRFTADQTREMKSSGVIDLQTSNENEVRTWVKFITNYVMDVTRNDQ